MNPYKRVVLIVSMLWISISHSQNNVETEGAFWFTMSNKIKLSEKFYLDNLLQIRRVDFLESTKILFDRVGVNYKLNTHFLFGVGYFYQQSHAYGTFHPAITRKEHRLWEAVTIKSKIGNAKLANRFVFEQRFKDKIIIDGDSHEISGNVYSHRFRYRLLLSFNLFKLKNGKHILGIVADEIRIKSDGGFSDPSFDQNNFDMLIGYELLKNSKVWIGYARNYYKINSSNFLAENTLRINFSYDFDFTKIINKKEPF